MSYVTYENSAFTGTTAVYKMANDKIESYARAYSNASSATRNSAQEFFVAQK